MQAKSLYVDKHAIENYQNVIGIDEVGRGCWAGPLVAAAVYLKSPIIGLKDSKKLTKNNRKNLAQKIEAESEYGLGWVSSKDVDMLGLTNAIRLAMNKAISKITVTNRSIIIDGNFNFLPQHKRSICIIKADQFISAVSAASILAKVKRDEYMLEIAKRYPDYGFEKNVGYGTTQHKNGLDRYGITSIHRCSYRPIKRYIA
jgi:ribonuclease HII